MRKAEQFWDASQLVEAFVEDEAIGDAYVTLCVHAGIAAADVVCCVRLAAHPYGERHADALATLQCASPGLEKPLAVLLALKTRSGYGHEATGVADRRRVARATGALLLAARLAMGE